MLNNEFSFTLVYVSSWSSDRWPNTLMTYTWERKSTVPEIFCSIALCSQNGVALVSTAAGNASHQLPGFSFCTIKYRRHSRWNDNYVAVIAPILRPGNCRNLKVPRMELKWFAWNPVTLWRNDTVLFRVATICRRCNFRELKLVCARC